MSDNLLKEEILRINQLMNKNIHEQTWGDWGSVGIDVGGWNRWADQKTKEITKSFVDAGDQQVALAQLGKPVPGVGHSSDTLAQTRFQCVEDRATSQ